MPKDVKYRGATRDIAAWLLDNVGREVTLTEMGREFTYPIETIQKTMGYIVSTGKVRLQVLVAGHRWAVQGAGAREVSRKSPEIFEEIGRTRNGDILIEGEDGTVYRAVVL
jgi:hypothetical protein